MGKNPVTLKIVFCCQNNWTISIKFGENSPSRKGIHILKFYSKWSPPFLTILVCLGVPGDSIGLPLHYPLHREVKGVDVWWRRGPHFFGLEIVKILLAPCLNSLGSMCRGWVLSEADFLTRKLWFDPREDFFLQKSEVDWLVHLNSMWDPENWWFFAVAGHSTPDPDGPWFLGPVHILQTGVNLGDVFRQYPVILKVELVGYSEQFLIRVNDDNLWIFCEPGLEYLCSGHPLHLGSTWEELTALEFVRVKTKVLLNDPSHGSPGHWVLPGEIGDGSGWIRGNLGSHCFDQSPASLSSWSTWSLSPMSSTCLLESFLAPPDKHLVHFQGLHDGGGGHIVFEQFCDGFSFALGGHISVVVSDWPKLWLWKPKFQLMLGAKFKKWNFENRPKGSWDIAQSV